jgi:fructokinase
VDTHFVGRARAGLATGTVQVAVDVSGNATYDIVRPVAWDEIRVPAEAMADVAGARALVFGSLAGRASHNLAQLQKLLSLAGPMKFFDVNLRPPFADPTLIMHLARRADVMKLNDDEVGRLASYVRTGTMTPGPPQIADALASQCAALAEASGVSRICVTRGAEGAAWWERGCFVVVPAPRVVVRDTVGAGDAFMAGLVAGLTRGGETRKVLENACRLGAFVASRSGATPALPPEIIREFNKT